MKVTDEIRLPKDAHFLIKGHEKEPIVEVLDR